jgi:hypothetical protein
LHAHNDETNGSIEFIVAADALLEISTAIISAVMLLDDPEILLPEANDFDVRMNTRSVREHSMLVLEQLLRNWREQRPSNQGDLDSSVTGKVGRVHYMGADLLPISFLYRVRIKLTCTHQNLIRPETFSVIPKCQI